MEKEDWFTRLEEHFHVLSLGEESLGLGKILSTDTSLKILETVYSSDPKVGVSAGQVSEKLSIARPTVLYHLGRMQEAGLLSTNPVLQNEESWNRFWALFRNRGADVTKEQFNAVHDARMNGVKLFVPTKKGFLVLPSTSRGEGMSMFREAVQSVTTVSVERGYKKMRKASALFGTLGLLLIAVSFLYQLPFFQPYLGPQNNGFSGGQVSPLGETAASEAAAPPASETALTAGRGQSAVQKTADQEPDGTADEAVPTTPPQAARSAAGTQLSVENQTPLAPKALFFLGSVFLGSYMWIVIYSRLARRPD